MLQFADWRFHGNFDGGQKALPKDRESLRVELCGPNRFCRAAIDRGVQIALVSEAGLQDLGTIVARASETLLKGTFHPSTLFQENRLILEQDIVNLKL